MDRFRINMPQKAVDTGARILERSAGEPSQQTVRHIFHFMLLHCSFPDGKAQLKIEQQTAE